MKAIATIGLVALLAAGAVFYFRSGETSEPGEEPRVINASSPEGEAGVADAMQAKAEAPKSKEKKLARKHRLYFPDGSYLQALNGATNAAPVEFRGRPFAPVIGKQKDSSGREWYVHEDGSQSTTVMGWRRDLGRYDAITEVAHPTDPRPLVKNEVVGPGGIDPPTKAGGAGAPPKK